MRATKIEVTKSESKEFASILTNYLLDDSEGFKALVEMALEDCDAAIVASAAVRFNRNEATWCGPVGGATVELILRAGRRQTIYEVRFITASSKRVIVVNRYGISVSFPGGSQHLAGRILADCYKAGILPDIQVLNPLPSVAKYNNPEKDRHEAFAAFLWDFAEDLEDLDEFGVTTQSYYTRPAIERALAT